MSVKKIIAATIIALLLGGCLTYWFMHSRYNEYKHDMVSKLLNVEEELSETKKDLLGYIKFTDYLTETKKAIHEQMKFLAAKVVRDYVLIEHIQKSKLGVKSEATVIVKYEVEYSFGYDLKPESFSISGDRNGITVTLKHPELVASPAVKIISHEIPSKGILIDEKEALLELQQELPTIAQNHSKAIQKDEAVIALCEKKLGEFLRDFLSKQPNVRVIPTIKFAYK